MISAVRLMGKATNRGGARQGSNSRRGRRTATSSTLRASRGKKRSPATRKGHSTALREALKLIGPSPMRLAESAWQTGIAALRALGPRARELHPGIQAAAILTLAENRPGMVKFWEGVCARTLGWPSILLAASDQSAQYPEGRTVARQAELGLYMACRFAERASFSCLEDKLLRSLREPFEAYRVRALQATFIGRLRRKNEIPEEEWTPVRARTPTVRISVTAANGSRISIALERAFFEDVASVLGDRGARAQARAIADTYEPKKESVPLSSIVHDELAMLISENLLAARMMGLENAAWFENPVLRSVPKPRKPRTQVKRSPDDVPYRRNTSVIINCAYQNGKGTAVSMPRPLYELACKRLGKLPTHEIFRHAAESWDPESTELSRSQVARYALLLELCRATYNP